jgi:hypothetical protein
MNKIMAELNKKFSGQSAARLDTYAGKMGLLTVAAEDARETIGKGLLDALSLLGKDTSISSATKLMDDFATSTADAVVGIAVLVKELKKLGDTKVGGVLFDVKNIPVLGAYLAGFSEIGAAQRAQTAPSNREGRSASRIYLDQLRKESRALQVATTLRKQENAQLKAKTEVDKLSEKFDTERIGLMKALNEATDAETKLRLQAKIAILDNNEALAKKYNAELEASAAARTLADSANNAANALNTLPSKYDAIFASLVNTFKAMGSDTGSAASLAGASARLQAQADAFLAQMSQYAVPGGGMPSSATTAAGTTAPVTVQKVEVNTGAVLTNQQDLSIYIQNALGEITKLGNGALIPAGSIAFQ